MATAPTIHSDAALSLDQYLRTSFHPDCDFVDGHLEPRRPPEGRYTQHQIKELFVGEYEHNMLQKLLILWFGQHEKEWGINCVPEQRIQVSPGSIRVCDFAALRAGAPRESVIRTPPLLCIEILSPSQRLARARIVLEDYRLMGVPHIWLLDPFKRKAWTYSADGLHAASIEHMQIPASPIYIRFADLIAQIV